LLPELVVVVVDEDDAVDGAAAGAAVLDPPAEAADALLLSPEPFGFGLEYRSEYHPPPLKLTAGAESTRSRCPLQCGQIVISGSENFCLLSVRSWHSVHSYS